MLEELGYCVIKAANGFEALDRLQENPNLDVMVTDIRMPGMSGFELYDLVTAQYNSVKILMMSGYFTPQATQCRLLRKPFRTVELDNAIRELLAG